MKARVSMLLLAALLATGFAGRAARYATDARDLQHEAEVRMRAVLEPRGWRAVERLPLTANGSYSAIEFRKPGCATPMLVSFAGNGVEAAALYERSGHVWTFLRGAEESSAPQTIRFMIDSALARMTGRPVAPILAVTGPREDSAWCTRPAPADWAGLAN